MSSIVWLSEAHRGMGCGAAHLWSAGAVEVCTRGRCSRFVVHVSPVEMYGMYQASPDVTKSGQEPIIDAN